MKIVANNRKAMYEYDVIDTYEAGIVLRGGEVKSLRQGTVSLSDAYGELKVGEVYLINLHITPYKYTSHVKLDPKRRRKILLNKSEIKKLYGMVQQRGNALIPLKIYFNDKGIAKITIGICRRKKLFDKKRRILQKEAARDLGQIKKGVR